MITPHKSEPLLRWFRLYNRHFLRRNFHRVHLDGDLSQLMGDGHTPLLLCVNHSSWWDLLMGVLGDELLDGWDSYAPMDEVQLRRYRFFASLGVIGVDRTSLHGAKEFVAFAQELLHGKQRALWITPQGEFTSNTRRPIHFQPGVGHIAQELGEFYVSTVVFDYEHWSEKRPEAFLSLKPFERITVTSEFDRKAFVHRLEQNMESHLDALQAIREQRNPALFTPLLQNGGGISPVYDVARSITAKWRGEPLVRAHGEVETTPWREMKRPKP